MTRVPVLDTSNRIDARHLPVLSSALIADFNEAAQDAIAAALASGTHQNVTVTYNDITNSFNLSVAGLAQTDQEVVRDTMGAALRAGTGVSLVVDDPGDTITINATGNLDAAAVRSTIATALRGGTNVQITSNAGAGTITISTTATDRQNHTGTQLASTISDFAVAVQAAAPSGTYMAQDSLVWNAKDHGIYGDGTTDDTGAINSLATLAYNSSPNATIYFPPGTYKILSEVNFATNLNASQATFVYGGTATAVSLGYIGSLTSNKVYRLPRILCSTQGWGTQSVPALKRGLYMVNLQGCEIHIPYVKWFTQGIRLQAIGGFECKSNTIFLGILDHNRRQFIIDSDTTAGSTVDNNNVIGGNFEQDLTDTTTTMWLDDQQTSQLQVGGPGAGKPSNNTFTGLDLGGDNPSYYRMECNGNNNKFINCSWKFSGTRSRVLWSQDSFSNDIDGGYNSDYIALTNQSTAQAIGQGPNTVSQPTGMQAGMLMMYGGQTTPAGWLVCHGQQVSKTTYSLLWTNIGAVYGTPTSTTFALPRFDDRVPLGSSTTKQIGLLGGQDSNIIQVTNLPPHTHSINHGHAAQNTSGVSTFHVHSMSHNHADTTTSGVGDHLHNISFSDNAGGATGTGNHIPRGGPNETGLTSNAMRGAGNHTHVVGIPWNYLNTAPEGEHVHASYTPDFGGNSGGTGDGSSMTNMPPYVVVNYVIKF